MFKSTFKISHFFLAKSVRVINKRRQLVFGHGSLTGELFSVRACAPWFAVCLQAAGVMVDGR